MVVGYDPRQSQLPAASQNLWSGYLCRVMTAVGLVLLTLVVRGAASWQGVQMPRALKLGRSACARLGSVRPNSSWWSTLSCHQDGTETSGWLSCTAGARPLPLSKPATRLSPWGQHWIGGSMNHRDNTTRQPIESRSQASVTPVMSEEPFSEFEMSMSQFTKGWQTLLGTAWLRNWMICAWSVGSVRQPGSLEGWSAGSATASTEVSRGSTEKPGEITLRDGDHSGYGRLLLATSKGSKMAGIPDGDACIDDYEPSGESAIAGFGLMDVQGDSPASLAGDCYCFTSCLSLKQIEHWRKI